MSDPHTPADERERIRTVEAELKRLDKTRKNIPRVLPGWSHTPADERERIRTVEAELAKLRK